MFRREKSVVETGTESFSLKRSFETIGEKVGGKQPLSGLKSRSDVLDGIVSTKKRSEREANERRATTGSHMDERTRTRKTRNSKHARECKQRIVRKCTRRERDAGKSTSSLAAH